MSDQTILCPHCRQSIVLNQVLSEEIEKGVREREKNLDAEVLKKLESEKIRLWKIAQEEAGKKNEMEMKDLRKANEEKESQLDTMRKQELTLRQKARELETREKNLELDLSRKMDEAGKKIAEQVRHETEESSKMKFAEKEKQIEQMKKALEEATRKAEQGSMQIQGDAQETDLKQALQRAFAMDTIEDVATGIRGADLIQTVFSAYGQKQGVIVWESKNTKEWNNEWIKKLKDDQARVKGDVVIIATQVLPEGLEAFGCRDGVWITEYRYALPLVATLRQQMGELSRVKQSLVGKDAKMELLYNYLGGAEFKNRIETIVLAFVSLKGGLDAEKRAMEKIWSRREKEIDRVIKNTTGFYGDLEGIMGASLPNIAALELPGESAELIGE